MKLRSSGKRLGGLPFWYARYIEIELVKFKIYVMTLPFLTTMPDHLVSKIWEIATPLEKGSLSINQSVS